MPDILADPLEGRYMILKTIGDPSVEAGIGDLWDLLRWQGERRVLGFDRAAAGMGGAAIMRFLIEHTHAVRFVTLPFGFREIGGFAMETGDYYMGFYVVAERGNRTKFRTRIHLNHVSAHKGDALYDPATMSWTDGRPPIRYSRESLQLLLDVESAFGLRGYIEGSRLYLHDQLDGRISPWWWRIGAEYRHPTDFLLKPWIAADVRTFDVDEESGGPLGVRLLGGIRLGEWGDRGVSAVISHYNGPDWRGQYFNEPANEWHLGIYADFR